MVLISLYFVLTFILWKYGPTMHYIFFVPLFLATCWYVPRCHHHHHHQQPSSSSSSNMQSVTPAYQ